jgi:hypothetical protein
MPLAARCAACEEKAENIRRVVSGKVAPSEVGLCWRRVPGSSWAVLDYAPLHPEGHERDVLQSADLTNWSVAPLPGITWTVQVPQTDDPGEARRQISASLQEFGDKVWSRWLADHPEVQAAFKSLGRG